MNLQFDEQSGLACKIMLPEEKPLMRWIMNMRPLLDPKSEIRIEATWDAIRGTFADKIPPVRRAQVDQAMAHLRTQAPFKLLHNDREVTCEIAYEEVATRAFWTSDLEAMRYRKEFLNEPGAGILYEYLFYDHQRVAYRIAAMILGHVWQVEEKSLNIEPWCIYCLTSCAAFSSEEHVIPEMLGNDEVVLPPQFVCNTCNNKLAAVDAYLVESPICMGRVYHAGPGKDGKMQRVRFKDGVLEQINPHKFRHTRFAGKWKKPEPEPDGTYRFTISGTGRKKFDANLAGRALYKMALGMLAFKHGRDFACSPRYDEARRFIRYGGPFPNALVLFKKGDPKDRSITMRWEFGEEKHPPATTVFTPRGTIFHIGIYGMRLGLNLEALPLLFPTEPAEQKWLI